MPISSIPSGGGGGGTVTSVGLVLPTGIFDVTGSPVTAAGDLTATLDNQTTKTFFAGPTSGSPATPAFRVLASADLPSTAVTPGTFTNATVTVDQQGRLTAASTGSGGGNVNGYGAVASLPATCAVGDTYTPSDRIWTYFAIATNTWQAYLGGSAITPPVVADWSFEYNGSTTSTITQTAGGMKYTKNNQNFISVAKNATAAPVAPWTVELGFSGGGKGVASYDFFGLALLESAAGASTKFESLFPVWDGTDKQGLMSYQKFTNPNTLTGAYTNCVSLIPPVQQIWIKIVNDNTDINGYVSYNGGADWVFVNTHAKAAFLSGVGLFGLCAANENGPSSPNTNQDTWSVFHYKVS